MGGIVDVSGSRNAGNESGSDRGRITLGELLIIAAQLALLALVIRQFQIENRAFLRVVLLAFGGFLVHAVLPLRHRLPFFAALSLAAIALVFGPVAGAWLVAIGLGLIGVCHLPVRLPIRVGLLVGIGALLALHRVDWLHAPWSMAVWPILGSMFMFRLIVYLYDLSHETTPPSVSRTLSYFFLLPNVCFPLFPVIDYKTFRRNYYDDQPYRIYQVGVDWMARGVMHLILYRVVYYYFTLGPSEVRAPADLAQYLLSTFLLYLRVSGQFHLIVGMLHLFGFNQPETHHRYFLASSFTDFWRRINIYWKDFMLKVIYYPVYFRLRALGTTTALVLSTLVVFLATWLLHSYQWFWLRGSFPLLWQDVIFWGVLALLVVGNSLYETHHGRRRTLGKSTWDPRWAALGAAKTAATFCVICVLWSLWTSESLSAWAGLGAVLDPRSVDARLVPLLVAALVVAGGAGRRADASGGRPRWFRIPLPRTVTVGSLAVLAVIGLHPVYSRFHPTAATVIGSLRSGGLSRLDTALLERGYYEDLVRVDRFNSQLWELYMNKPLRWLDVFEGSGLTRFTGDFLQTELLPSFTSVTRYGTIRTNRWGMRDQEYERTPSPATYRIAMLGASTVMGWGVGDDETFEALVERRFNDEPRGVLSARYEILNFGVPGYLPLRQLMVLDKAVGFQPGAVFYIATGREPSGAAQNLLEAVRDRLSMPDEYLRETARRAGVEPETDETTALRRLQPFRDDLLGWLYRRIVERCGAAGIVPVWVFLPQVEEGGWRQEVPVARRLAAEAGFVVIDLSGVYDGHDIESIRLAEWDNHPNARGHRLIADRLYRELVAREDLLFLGGRARAMR